MNDAATADRLRPPAQAGVQPPTRMGPASHELRPRHRALLDQLDEIVTDEGFAHLSVADIASRLHCSRRTLYELAPSKSELVLIVIDRRLRHTAALAEDAIATASSSAERLEAYMVAGTSELKRATIRFREDVATFPAARRLIADHYRYATAVITGLIRDGIKDSDFREHHAALLAAVIDAALERLQDPALLAQEHTDFEDAVRELAAIICRGLRR